MISSSIRRSLVLGTLGIAGSAAAFWVGARAGSSLDHHTRTVSIAKIPVQQLEAPRGDREVLPPSEVAQK